jgi:hypothetical protein
MPRKPKTGTIVAVVQYLESVGLQVYGPYIDLESGEYGGCCMDFDTAAIRKYLRLVDSGKIHITIEEEA